MHAPLSSARTRRPGMVLLVVVSLLTLFAIVGLSFVLYAESQAKTAHLFREAGVQTRPDVEPELLLNFFLGQLLYGTDDVHSALRGHSLAENMFGYEGPGTLNSTPYSGIGRFHHVYDSQTQRWAPPVLDGQDNYDLVNYTYFGTDGFLRDPERLGPRGTTEYSRYLKGSVSYTYPDANNMFLAAVKAADGRVLARSFHREYTSLDAQGRPRGFGTLDQGTNPNWNNPIGKYLTLRPRPADHSPAFPYPEDEGGDVKNLTDSPGYLIPGTTEFATNDSIWIDLGFPVQRTPDGRMYKPLFAPLIQDLDNRVNVNVHGNVLGYRFREDERRNLVSTSHQGWCPGEVSLQRVITGRLAGDNRIPEIRNLFFGLRLQDAAYNPRNAVNHLPGRYNRPTWRDPNGHRLANPYAPGGHFYCSTDLDCWEFHRFGLTLPTAGSGRTTPTLQHDFSHGWYQADGMDKPGHPNLYNVFDPESTYYVSGGQARVNNRSFAASNLEALLRYSDTGSPALSSELFQLCPRSFQDPKTRRLVTTHSFDLARPGVTPTIWEQQGHPNFELGPSYPFRPPQRFPDLANRAPGREFGTNWEAVTHGLPNNLRGLVNRIDLNRGFADYPPINQTSHRFTDTPQYTQFNRAHDDRVRMAQEIFQVLRSVTGAADPAQASYGSREFDGLRWLAQLAVNMVDYLNFPRPGATHEAVSRVDDVMTCFNWNPRFREFPGLGWVIGTVYPRLVLNEAYVEIANVPASGTPTASQFDVNFWVELHNPFSSNGGNRPHTHPAIPLAENGTARLYVPEQGSQLGYAPYRVILARRGRIGDPLSDNQLLLRQVDNVLGTPANMEALVDRFTPDRPPGQRLELEGDDLRKVLPANLANTPFRACNAGLNRGFFVLGPKVAFPGTASTPRCFATLPVRDQLCSDPLFPTTHSRMTYRYDPPRRERDFSHLLHSIVLQRLACPYLPPNPLPGIRGHDPTRPVNPYVTVDYLDSVPINDAVTLDGFGAHQPTPLEARISVGRNQPYAAEASQQIPQRVPTAGRPQHTFFQMNYQGESAAARFNFPYDWLVHLNRCVISPMELLHVSAYKPSELTQQFMLGGTSRLTGEPSSKFRHRAPWFEPDALIWRALEFFEAGFRPQMAPTGGRFPGRINLNTVWDVETLMALGDPQGTNYFTEAGIQQVFQRLLQSRTPNGSPGPRDRPFRGLAAAHAPPGVQYPLGSGLDDTYLRPAPDLDPEELSAPRSQWRRLFQPKRGTAELKNEARDHAYLQDELMIKTFGNTTTRSHVFAVWLTVGFFEVVEEGTATRPPRLGAEIGKAENRHLRQRMFAVIDRSRLTRDPDNPGQAGPVPFFIESKNAVSAGPATVQVPVLSGNYDQFPWAIRGAPNPSRLVVNAGAHQEIVLVVGNPANARFDAQFTRAHPPGVAISNTMLGHPGPQPKFDFRDPRFQGIVRYFSTVVR